jgi:glucose-6-phosphate 1-dehydrogenase
LQHAIEAVFPENEIYRIDHYLGKEPVQDIIALRFANTIFEPIWNRNYVQNVQITSAESLGVEERGAYYDHAGALRDMIQNHVINLLALVAMEAPISSDADDIRNEKYKVLSAIEPPAHSDVWSMSARGQYGPGTIDGNAVKGYRQEENVAPDSNTETFAAVRLSIENWRWAGVPFYLRSGKRLPRKVSEIAVTFKPIPHRFYGESTDSIEPNVLVIKIEPDEGISMRFEAKVPGPKDHVRSVYMDFSYGSGFGVQSPPAYERLIGDAMQGDQTLFTRWDAVERAWEIVTPILEVWQNTKDFSFPNYAAGSQGPDSAVSLFPDWRRI